MATAGDIRSQDEAAAEQRRALNRLEHARRERPFDHRGPLENRTAIFEAETRQRNHFLGRA